MTFEVYYECVIAAFSENGMENLITRKKAQKLYELSNLLIEANKITNLTAITDEKEILLKHFVDSAAVSEFIEENAKVIDIGCGAGFPSLPLAILREDLRFTSLDSTGKKIEFVKNAASTLALNNVEPVCARAEDFALERREKYDVSVSRAVARLNVLSEISLPMVKVGGKFIAMKSNKGQEEYEEAKKGLEILGGKLAVEKEVLLRFEANEISRTTYVIKKEKQIPSKYPRKYAQILKKPL